jgi:uncharacterized cupredoxin-like copper-binding protein
MRPGPALIGLLALAALAGCGGSGHKTGAAGAQGTRVTAKETEFHIALSQQSFAPGTYTFVAQNDGKLAHSLEIDGPGVSNQRIAGTIAPGQSQSLTVTLQKGSYEIFCPVPGHKQQGMDTHISVGGAAVPSGGMSTGGGSGY